MSSKLRRLGLGLLGLGLLAGFVARREKPEREAGDNPPPRLKLTPDMLLGAEGAGGYFAAWPSGAENPAGADRIEYQYSGMRHQADAAISGMWLFLVTEVLFFAGLFLLYLIYRHLHPAGFAAASEHAELTIGSMNTVLLLTSSAVYSYGLGRAEMGDNRRLLWACVVTIALGVLFLGLKGYEWMLDFNERLFPGPNFVLTGDHSGEAQLFWSFYFVATGLHGIHMIVGIGLVGWIAALARCERFSAGYATPVEVVGLYWSFVDMVWLCLYPMIYLVHPAAP